MSEGDSSDGHEDDEKVTNDATLTRIYTEAIESVTSNLTNLRDSYQKAYAELRIKNTALQSAATTKSTRVEKLEKRYQQALEYNNSVSSENEDLNTQLKKARAQLAAAQATIKSQKAQLKTLTKKGSAAKGAVARKKRVVKAEPKKQARKTRVKRERDSSSSSSRSPSRRRNGRSNRRGGRSRSRSRSNRGRKRSRSDRWKRSRSGSSGSSSPPRKKRLGKAPPPPTKRNPTEEKAFTFKPGSLGVKCKGVLVHEVTKGAQAEGLGIKQNWKIVEVNDVTVNNLNVREKLKMAIQSGKPFTLTFNTKITAT